MTTKKWLKEFESYLKLKRAERKKIVEFYAEVIADKRESGQTDEEIVSSLGNPYDVAVKVMEESGITVIKKGEVDKQKTVILDSVKKLPLWAIITLAFFGVIIGIPLLAVVFSIVITCFALCVSGFAIAISCGLASIVSLFIAIFNPAMNGFAIFGGMLVATGVGILMALTFGYLSKLSTKLGAILCKGFFKKGKKE